jgi:hypothetical protein
MDLEAMRVAALDALGTDWTTTRDGRIVGLLDGISAFDVAEMNPEGELSDEARDANAAFMVMFQPSNALRLLDRLAKAEAALGNHIGPPPREGARRRE